jgi:hypothetical protein
MTPEQTLDWLAEQHKSQCNEDRPVQEWIRSMKSMLPAPVQEPVALEALAMICVKCRSNEWGPDTPRKEILNWFHDFASNALDDTTPPAAQRQWVGLTVDELITLEQKHRRHEDLSRAIEQRLKEKNT